MPKCTMPFTPHHTTERREAGGKSCGGHGAALKYVREKAGGRSLKTRLRVKHRRGGETESQTSERSMTQCLPDIVGERQKCHAYNHNNNE